MAHHFTFTVQVEIQRDAGKFTARDELAEELREWLESADQGSIDGVGADGESTYSTSQWEVEEA